MRRSQRPPAAFLLAAQHFERILQASPIGHRQRHDTGRVINARWPEPALGAAERDLVA